MVEKFNPLKPIMILRKKQSDTSNPLARMRHSSFEKLPEWVGLRGLKEPDFASGYGASDSPRQRPLLGHLVLRLPPLVPLTLPLFFVCER